MIKSLQPSDRINFGKNKGLTLAEIYEYQPSYLEWAIFEIKDFKIDIEKFENLPAPTTIGYNKRWFEEIKSDLLKRIEGKEEFNIEMLIELVDKTDTVNPFFSVSEIKEMIQSGSSVEELENFRFPEKIREINNAK